MTDDVGAVLRRAIEGERRAIGRLLSMAERGSDADALDVELSRQPSRRAQVIGITGSPGAGKSTLTGRLLGAMTAVSRRAAVLAVDPTSPNSGGAILGDRVRMVDVDDDTFIRSVASRGSHGGLATAIPAMIRVLEATGFDIVIIETVGVGQIELDIAALADTTVVVLTPRWGDSVQASKAGILEIADVFAVNKADQPGAQDTVRDLEHMLDLSRSDRKWRPPIVRTIATDGTGIEELLDAIDDHASVTSERRSGQRRVEAELRARVDRAVGRAVDGAMAARPDLIGAIDRGELTAAQAAREVLASLARGLAV